MHHNPKAERKILKCSSPQQVEMRADSGAEDNLLKEGRKTHCATAYSSLWTVSWAFSDIHGTQLPTTISWGSSRMQYRPRSTCRDIASVSWGPYR